MQNTHQGHRSRIRDRVKKDGIENFQDYQVLEYALTFVIPYKDTNPIAHELINKFGSLGAVLEADEEDLKSVKGMGEVSAHFLTSIIKIYNFYEKEKSSKIDKINCPEEAITYIKQLFVGKLVEELYLICLLPNNKIAKCERIAQGNMGQAKVTIRKITDTISRYKVNNVIVAHNHPKGKAIPSIDDDTFTKALVTSLAINDSFLVDHVIIGEHDHYSYKQKGLIDKYREDVSFLLHAHIAQNEMTYYVNKEVDYD